MISDELIARCKNRDRASQYELYRYCYDLLMPVCMRYNRNEHDAAAALNVCYIKIIDHIESKNNEVNFNAWCKRITINYLIDQFRKNKRRKALQVSTDPTLLHGISHDVQLSQAEHGLDAEHIIELIQKLKEPARTIFNLHAIEGFSHDEIADKLSISTDNSRYHLHTARKKLRTQLIAMAKINKLV